MKYIFILIFYIVAFFWHLIDVIFRTIANLIIATWDFKWKKYKFYSYREIWYIGDKFGDGKDRQVPLSIHYSLSRFLHP
jgi:hypothetical protein